MPIKLVRFGMVDPEGGKEEISPPKMQKKKLKTLEIFEFSFPKLCFRFNPDII